MSTRLGCRSVGSPRFCPGTRRHWEMDPCGLLKLASEVPNFGCFVEMFRREAQPVGWVRCKRKIATDINKDRPQLTAALAALRRGRTAAMRGCGGEPFAWRMKTRCARPPIPITPSVLDEPE